MNTDVVNFIRQACKKLHLQAYFQPKHRVYVIHLDGRGIQNFTERQFYEVPKAERMRMLFALLRVGLNANLDTKHRDTLFTSFKKGTVIVP